MKRIKKLNRQARETEIPRPTRILQFGEGNFLRAFADWFIDIANERGLMDTSVAIVSPRFNDNGSIARLREQDCLYHVLLEGIEGGRPKREIRLIESVCDVMAPSLEPDRKRYEKLTISPDLRFVISNTTEAGIRYERDDVLSQTPATFPGKVTNLLWRRFRHFKGDTSKGLIFICCELIEDNASTLRKYVERHAREASLGDDFVNWVDDACIFADTLVDRIVPGFPTDSINDVKAEIGYDDNAVVKGELYHLWAIAGKGYRTVAREFPLDKAGLHVMFMPSIKAFRDKKVRILNGSHTAMVPIALQLGCTTVAEAFSNTYVNSFINKMVESEVLPAIDGKPAELHAFASGILERFYNPYIKHYLNSIALNSLSKWEARNFPTVLDTYKKTGHFADHSLFAFAALLSLYGPETAFSPDDNDEHIAAIAASWNSEDYELTVRTIVDSGIFTADFEKLVPGFSAEVAVHLSAICRHGMEKALADFISTHTSDQ